MSMADGLMILQVEIETLKTEDRRNHRVAFDKIRERLDWKTFESGIREIYGAICALVRAGAKQRSPLQKEAKNSSERGVGHAAGL